VEGEEVDKLGKVFDKLSIKEEVKFAGYKAQLEALKEIIEVKFGK